MPANHEAPHFAAGIKAPVECRPAIPDGFMSLPTIAGPHPQVLRRCAGDHESASTSAMLAA
jgi:hypothetical protein